MKVYVIQAEWSSGIPEQPELHLDEMAAQASWDSQIDDWIEVQAARLAGTDENGGARANVEEWLYGENPEGWGWGAGSVVLDDDSTMRCWVVDIEDRERAGSTEEPPVQPTACACIVTQVTSSGGGALCLCTEPTTGTRCELCLAGHHVFDGSGVRSGA